MNTLEAIYARRSIRSFTSDPLSDEDLLTLIQAAAAAPSGSNAQAWVFIAIRNSKRLLAVQSLSPGIISKPAAVIILCADYRQIPHPRQTTDIMITYDLGAALQNILLAATELGLGGCPVASFNKPGLMRLLNLPEGVEPQLLVTIGKPKFIPQKPPKKPLKEIFFEETYPATP